MRCGTQPLRVLIVSATVGAGDAGNARELARRLVEAGHEAEVRDFLESAPFGIGKALSKGYEAELRHAPWAYELAFKMWFWFPFLLAPLAWVLTFFTRKKILLWVRDTHADIVVSTYPVATQVLGELRRRATRRWRNRNGLAGAGRQFHHGFRVPPVLGAPRHRPQPGRPTRHRRSGGPTDGTAERGVWPSRGPSVPGGAGTAIVGTGAARPASGRRWPS